MVVHQNDCLSGSFHLPDLALAVLASDFGPAVWCRNTIPFFRKQIDVAVFEHVNDLDIGHLAARSTCDLSWWCLFAGNGREGREDLGA